MLAPFILTIGVYKILMMLQLGPVVGGSIGRPNALECVDARVYSGFIVHFTEGVIVGPETKLMFAALHPTLQRGSVLFK